MKKTILITGASSGIGLHTAQLLAREGHRLILCARRKPILDEQIKAWDCEALSIELDVRDRQNVENQLLNLPQEWQEIDVLVNNAGLASGLDTFHDGDLEDWETMIDTNIKGLLYVSKIMAQKMAERKKGHIINVGSVAGLDAYPMGNVYCSSKSFVDMLSKNMRLDLVAHGIKVSVIHPGAVVTGFSIRRFHGDEKRASQVYQGFTPLSGEDVGEVIRYMINVPPHVNLASVTLMPAAQASGSFIYKELPQ